MMNFVAEVQGKPMTDADLIKALRCCSDTANIEKTLDPCTACPAPKNRDGEYPNWCDVQIMALAAARLEELSCHRDSTI